MQKYLVSTSLYMNYTNKWQKKMNFENCPCHTESFLHIMHLCKNIEYQHLCTWTTAINDKKIEYFFSYYVAMVTSLAKNWPPTKKQKPQYLILQDLFFQTVPNSSGALMGRTCAYFEEDGSQTINDRWEVQQWYKI